MEEIEKKLRELYLDQHLPVFKIAEQLKLDVDQINYLRRKYKIPKIQRFERHNLELSDKQKRIILGTTLGDGCLHQKDSYHRLLLEHSEKQKEYLDWKVSQLRCLFKAKPHFCEKKSLFRKKNGEETVCTVRSYAITSISHPLLTELANQIYDSERNKHIKRAVLDFLDWEGLAVYYQDDGSASENVTLHVCNFDLESILELKGWLENRGILSCIAGKPKEYKLILNESSKETFLQNVRPFLVPCLSYKASSIRKDHTLWTKEEACVICFKTNSKKVGDLCQRCYSEIYRKGCVTLENKESDQKTVRYFFLKNIPDDDLFQQLRQRKGLCIYYKDFDPRIHSIKIEEYEIQEIQISEASVLLSKFHYHRRARRGDSLAVGLFWKKNLVGAIIYGRPVRDKIANSLNKICGTTFETNKVFELTRFVLTDGLPANTGSYFFTRSLKYIKQLGLSLLIAYSDTTQGHHGGLYRACNWIHIGTSYPNYHYRDKRSKEIITRSKAAYLAKRIGVDENTFAAQSGWEPELEKFKHKYVYPLSKKVRKTIQKRIVKIPIISPPDLEDQEVEDL